MDRNQSTVLELDFLFFGTPRCVQQRSVDIVSCEVGVKAEDFVKGDLAGNKPGNCTNSYPCLAKTGLAAHDRGIDGNSLELWNVHDPKSNIFTRFCQSILRHACPNL
jgi:hypothetical protein